MAKVHQLDNLKQKHDEDKAHVRLHCFGETWEDGEDASTSLEGIEKMQSLKSIDNYKATGEAITHPRDCKYAISSDHFACLRFITIA
ncbi:unnamed protein product [Eruca vesicaria subsp. sativa]|uniref:Uncharacterized protein n=1 Tax=Eruca vesicaria subsp. sativa TaxID=29727 RepID=A0ABC8JK56_ERUVS|nr:unnamed protein product [Eruca vesicaria subsp. sativa]